MGRRGLHLAARLALGQVPRSDAPALVVLYASTPQDGSELDLGTLNTAPGAVRTFTVRNDGRATLHASLAIADGSNLTSAVLSASSVSVAPGGSAEVTVTADATAVGAGGFSLVVTSDGGDLTVPVVFTGIEQDIEVSVGGSPVADGGTVSVPDMVIGTPVEVEITIAAKLTAGDDLTVTGVTLGTPVNASDVSSDWASVSGGNDVVLAPGETIVVTVTYTPTSAAPSIPVSVDSDDPTPGSDPWTFDLEGTAEDVSSLGDWVEWTYAMFGSGAPDSDPHTEYSSMAYAAGTGFNLTANFGAQRTAVPQMIAWGTDVTDIHVDGANDLTVGLEIEIRGAPSSVQYRIGGVWFGPGPTDAQSLGGTINYYTTTPRTIVHNDSGFDGTSTISGLARARVLATVLPGSGGSILGPMFVLARTSADALVSGAGILDDNSSGATEAAVQVGLLYGRGFSGSDGGAAAGGDQRIYSRGFIVPKAPWDGGPIGTGPGEWQLVTYDGSSPDSDNASATFVSGAAGDSWDVTIDATRGNSAQGWDPSTGNKRALWFESAPGTIDLSQPTMVAIHKETGFATDDQLVIGAGVRHNGTNDGPMVALQQSTTTSVRGNAASDANHATTPASTSATGVVGWVVPNRAASGTPQLGASSANIYSDTGPISTTGASHRNDGTATVTNPQLVVMVGAGTTGSANRRCNAKVWLCNPAIDLTTGPA